MIAGGAFKSMALAAQQGVAAFRALPAATSPPATSGGPGDGDGTPAPAPGAELGGPPPPGGLPGPGGSAAQPPRLRKTGSPSTRRRGSRVRVTTGLTGICPAGGAACSFRLVATARRVARSRATLTVAPGRSGRLTYTLGPRAARALRRLRRLRVTLSIQMRAGTSSPTTVRRTIAIRPPRR